MTIITEQEKDTILVTVPSNMFMQESFLSYYVTQCFQHVYLATSTLWGEDGQTVFGSNIAEFMRGSASFR